MRKVIDHEIGNQNENDIVEHCDIPRRVRNTLVKCEMLGGIWLKNQGKQKDNSTEYEG